MKINNACELNVDIVVIAEPYRQLPEWSCDTTGDAAVWVTGFNGKFATLTPVSAAAGIVAVEVEKTVVVGCYCSPSRKVDFGSYLDDLEGTLTELRALGKRLVLAGGFNAKSPAEGVGGRKTDRRGDSSTHSVWPLLD